MAYEIGFSPKGRVLVSKAYQPSAASALAAVKTLQARNDEIKYINTPEGWAIDFVELTEMAGREHS